MRASGTTPQPQNVNSTARFGTQTGTGRLSTGEDGTGLQPSPMRGKPDKILLPDTE